MISELCKLSLVLVLGLVVWSVYDHSKWDEDYTRYEAAILDIPALDSSYINHIRPKLFKDAVVISNDTHLNWPEDVAVSSQGVIYTGLLNGQVVSVTPGSNETTSLVHHPESGRIYGIILTSDESTLYYATDYKGLVKLDLKTLKHEYLLNEVEGKPIGTMNALAID